MLSLLALAVGLLTAPAWAELGFATVPLASEVPAADVGRYTSCLASCALQAASAVAPFSGCSWITQAITKGSGCQISKPCFRKCFDPQAGVYTNRYSPLRQSFVVDAKLSPSTVPDLQLQHQWPVDGAVYAQPLYAPGVKFADHAYRNLVIIATEFNSVFAFDAETREQLWNRSLTVGRVVTAADIPAVPSRPGGPCTDIAPYYGITSTPVIDPATDTVYVMSYSVEGADVFTTTQFRFNALDLATGAHRTGSPTAPVAATRTFPNGVLPNNATTFVAIKQLQRPGLALHKGLVYAAFGSHCDRPPYYPWLFAFDARTLAISSFWTTPVLISRFNQTNPAFGPVEGGGPTIWMGGTAPTIFQDKLYVVTGRGPVDPANGGIGNAILRFPLDLSAVEDYFIPSNGVFLDNNDLDLGSSGAVVIKGDHVITGGKQGPLYIADAAKLGGYDPNANNANVFQVINPAPLNSTNPTGQSVYSGPAYWAGNGGQVFIRGRRSNQALYRFAWNDATNKLSPTATAQAEKAVGLFSARASNPVVQAASADATEAVLWEIDEQSSLLAWDAMSLRLLYSSNNTVTCGGTPSSAGGVVKFHLVTIAEGRVYLGCGDRVLVYGLPA